MRISNIVLLLVLAITAIIASVSAMPAEGQLVQGGQHGIISGEEKMMEETQTRRMLRSEVVAVTTIKNSITRLIELIKSNFAKLKNFVTNLWNKRRGITKEPSLKKTGSSKSNEHGSVSKKESSVTKKGEENKGSEEKSPSVKKSESSKDEKPTEGKLE